MLIEKANSGVDVYIMVWSEKSSGDIVGEQGIMGTHDMETFNFFKSTKVCCALAPREIAVNEFTDFLQNPSSIHLQTLCHPQNWLIGEKRIQL